MYMDGFQLAGFSSGSAMCLNFLSPSLTMDSHWKFAAGCFAAFLLALMVEGLTCFRRYCHKMFNLGVLKGKFFLFFFVTAAATRSLP